MCESCKFADYSDKCDEILEEDELMGWCHETVDGIQNWIQENEHVTTPQKEAIDRYYNIMEEKRL